MKYLVLLIADGAVKPWTDHDEEEQTAVMAQFRAFDKACAAREGAAILAGEALRGPDSWTALRTRGGGLQITDGPYAEVVEEMGGFYLMEVPDLDVLVELLGVLPPYDMQLTPVADMEY
jgi:hypothetical protein